MSTQTPSTVPDGTGSMTAVEAGLERTRSRTGLGAVIGGDTVIGVAAIVALLNISDNETSTAAVVSILTSAFTAIGTMTTAYFGIKAASNTAQAHISRGEGRQTSVDPAGGERNGGSGEPEIGRHGGGDQGKADGRDRGNAGGGEGEGARPKTPPDG
jgi:hypothetical protein